MWPYWLDARDECCVENDVRLDDDMAVLSGPNMAGAGRRHLWCSNRSRVYGILFVCLECVAEANEALVYVGKSTFLRSLTAVALLANCGLPVPAAAGSSVPEYCSFTYCNFRGDSPVEGRSGFALEAHEMAIVLRRGRAAGSPLPRHFVCIDEFGKGTEDRHATALCAAILQHLDQVIYCYCCTLDVSAMETHRDVKSTMPVPTWIGGSQAHKERLVYVM